MKPSESMKLVAKLMAAYPRQKMGQETVEIYAEALADLDAGLAGKAVMRLISTSKWFPSIAEIREEYAEGQTQLPAVHEGFSELVALVRRRGYMRPPHPEDCSSRAIYNAIQAMGGWDTICLSENVEALRAHFARAYESTRRRVLDDVRIPAALVPQKQKRRDGALSASDGTSRAHGEGAELVQQLAQSLTVVAGDD